MLGNATIHGVSPWIVGFTNSEDDGTRTRNLRIDSPQTNPLKLYDLQDLPTEAPLGDPQSDPTVSALPPELANWDQLPEHIRFTILTLIHATKPTSPVINPYRRNDSG